MAGLFEKIPPEKRWEMTSKALWGLSVLRGSKTIVPLLGIGEGIISPIWGLEKFEEIIAKAYGDGGKRIFSFVKETFNIPVEDAVDATKLAIVSMTLLMGPELEHKIVEVNKERAVVRWTKCPVWERYKEFEVGTELRPCPEGHQPFTEKGFNSVNQKITCMLTKAMPRGDPYCEEIIEFKEE